MKYQLKNFGYAGRNSMELRGKFDEIYDSVRNGQHERAVEQMVAVGMSELPDMLDYFANVLNQPEIAIKAAKSYFRVRGHCDVPVAVIIGSLK